MSNVYLSGPISLDGTASPELVKNNLRLFADVAESLRALGYTVLSPAELDRQATWADYMKLCLPMVCAADCVGVLPGWEQSRGALLEVFVANQLGIRILTTEGLT